jgi:hypothetical protein
MHFNKFFQLYVDLVLEVLPQLVTLEGLFFPLVVKFGGVLLGEVGEEACEVTRAAEVF